MQEEYQNNYIDKSRDERANYGFWAFIIVLVVILAAVLIFVITKDSHYEKANEYLRNKQYTEALIELQKIDPGEKDYNKAQSKINYINGLTSYNMKLYAAALTYLSKVTPDDEYFHDAQLMLGNINKSAEDDKLKAKLDSLSRFKDTVIVRQETTEPKGGNNNVSEALSDTELNKRYFAKLKNLINNFETNYQSAAVAEVVSKKSYIDKMEAIRRDLINSAYDAKEKDPVLIQLKNDINTWADKRIAYINKLISENSVRETNTSRSLKEEGDKLYLRVKSQLNKAEGIY
jgi:hypothetical protein